MNITYKLLAQKAAKHTALSVVSIVSLVLFPAVAGAVTQQQASVNFNFSAPPNWVEQVKTQTQDIVTPDGTQDGMYYLVVDRQKMAIDANSHSIEQYSHYSYQLSNQEGLEAGSSISIDFDPTYETLQFHNLTVWRAGVPQLRNDSASFQILNSENERENLSYNGQFNLDIVLSDTRVGDVVEYSYTKVGSNPIYSGLREYRYDLTWGVPVQQVLYRTLSSIDAPLRQRRFASDQTFEMVEHGSYLEYRYQKSNIPSTGSEDQEEITLSDIEQWQQVVDWSLPLYRAALSKSTGVSAIADEIRQSHQTTAARVGAALNWTQSNIRYLGIEYGTNSHNPSPAQTTLRRRYGDCKDKAVLLIAILDELNIEASPALVHSGDHIALDNSPYRLHAFNHVIVHFSQEGKNHWIDPTKNYQKGALGEFSESEHGHALIIKPGSKNLSVMNAGGQQGLLSITKFIDIQDNDTISMKVATLRTMAEAEAHRRKINRSSLKETGNDYFDYYEPSFPGLVKTAGLSVEDRPDNTIITTEHYSFPFSPLANGTNSESNVRADDIAWPIVEIVDAESGDFTIPGSTSIDETIHLRYKSDIDYSTQSTEVDNDYFSYRFKSDVNIEKNSITLNYEYRLKEAIVPAAQLSIVQRDAKKVTDSFSIILNEATTAKNSNNLGIFAVFANKWSSNIAIAVLVVFSFIYLYALIEWQLDRRKTKPEGIFYPVSPAKFWLMSFSTMGLYLAYYMYCTFKYSRDHLNKKIWPIARALFSNFFLYSAYKQVRDYSEEDGNTTQLNKGKFILLSIAYFALMVLSHQLLGMILTLLAATCVYPLVKWVNNLNAEGSALYKHNSKIRPRHIFLSIISPLLFLHTVPMEINLLPSDEVVSEWQLWQFQRDFFAEHQIMQENESLQYFYSDSEYDFRLDGNGLTDKNLFSYWANTDGTLEHAAIPLSEISKLEIAQNTPGSSWAGGFIKAHNTDGETLTLYLPDLKRCSAPFLKQLRDSIPTSASYNCES